MSEIKVNLSEVADNGMSSQQAEESVLNQAVERGEIAKENVNIEPGVVKVDLRKFMNNSGEPAPEPEVIVVNEEENQETTLIPEETRDLIDNDPPAPAEETDDEGYVIINEVSEEEEIEDTKEPVQVTTVVENFDIPENLEDLVKFMKDTGGTLEDYVNLNKEYSDNDTERLLNEYYKATRPELDQEEIDFLIEEQFSWDEDYDDEKTVRKRKLALKEEVAIARKHMAKMKEDYYKEVKLSSKLSPEEKQAIEFYNKYNEERSAVDETNKQRVENFRSETKKLFTDFKGFDFNVGDKKFRYNVKNPEKVMERQSDVSNLISKFTGEDGTISDLKGWHKTLFMAEHGEALIQHFYEQGKTDAIKEQSMVSKNIDMDVRQVHTEKPASNDTIQVRALDLEPSSKLKIRFGKK